jgi:peptide/nickel transport system permease protein
MAKVDVERDEAPQDVAVDPTIPAEIVGRSPGQLLWRRFRKDRWALAGIGIVVLMIVLAITAPLFSRMVGHPVDAIYIRELTTDSPPGCSKDPVLSIDPTKCSTGFPIGPTLDTSVGPVIFGADGLARDLFVRVLYGAQTSLQVALLATLFEVILGVFFGVLAGFYRGKVDTFLSRMFDVFFALPTLLLMLGLSAACGAQREGCFGGLLKPGKGLIIFLIGFFAWPYLARIIRGQVLSLREKEFIEAARSLGASNRRIMFRDILPNIVAPVIVYATLFIPTNILAEAALSYLGLGVPPDVPSWGNQIAEATSLYRTAWWTMVFPGIFLFMTTLAFNLVGDGLRDAFDPKTA